MDFKFTEQQEMLRKTIRDFMEKECPKEKVRKWDSEANIKAVEEVFEKFKGLGVMGILIAEKYGGSGGNAIDFSIILEEMSRLCWGLACYYVEATIYGGAIIEECGSEEQKQSYLPRIARAEIRFARAYTEPDAGYDLAALKTSARADGSDYIINGQKRFITGPCSTTAFRTKSFSADTFALFTALAMADFSVFRMWKAALRSLNSTTWSASATGRPRIARARSLALYADNRTNFVVASISMFFLAYFSAIALSVAAPCWPKTVHGVG